MKLNVMIRISSMSLAIPLLQQAALALQSPASSLTPAETAAGWKLLFDGQSTSAWHGYKQGVFPAKGWVIEDGCLKSVAGDKGGDIITNDEYGDFELTLEWKAAPGANSGIIYRVNEQAAGAWESGPEFQIIDDAGAKIDPADPHSAAALYDLYPPAAGKELHPAGQFNRARIRLQDNHLEHWLNGVKVVECDLANDEWKSRVGASKFKGFSSFGLQQRGRIVLQEHGDTVWFRNIKVRDLAAPMPGEVSLFDGKTLTGWTFFLQDPKARMEDTWRVEDGLIICKGEPAGYIRTENDYTNYVLKLQWRFNPVTKQAGNSGVLLRMIGADKVWPKSIEAQLHSGDAGDFWNIDDFQMQTDSSRTNGRNTKKLSFAERPIGQWNEYEIVVDHGDITVKVNGDPVNHAWGVAGVPGKLCLQSEGAEIHFRNIRLAPID